VTDVDEVLGALRRCRFLHATELDLQEGIAGALTAGGLGVRREVPLSARDRIDLLVDRVGIEVKIAGSWRDVQRQLERYAESDQIDELVLVTTKPLHNRVAAVMNGKPVRVHRAGSVL
jgi:hypothetical protein